MRDNPSTANEGTSLLARATRWPDDLALDEGNGAPEKPGARPGQFLSPYQELEHLRHGMKPAGGRLASQLSAATCQ